MTFSFYLFILTFFFWLFHIVRRTFFCLYLWQLKEYRLDRFFEEIRRNKKLPLPKVSLFALPLLLFSFVLFKIKFLCEGLVFILYFFSSVYSLYLFYRKKWRFPNFTKKMIVLFVFVLTFGGVLAFIFSYAFLPFILIFEILFLVFILFCAELIQVPTFFAKKRVMRKAEEKREQLRDLITIGITGSYGKTSTKEFLFILLSQKYKVLKTEGHVNTEMGVANTVLKELKKEHQIFICEVAAYKRGEIKAICDIAKPKIGILTGINEQHLALFGSQENIIEAKFELIESLPSDGIAIFNGNNKYCSELYGKTNISLKKITNYDIWAEDIQVEREFILFRARSKDGDLANFRVNLLGRQNIGNILLAACCAKELGMTLEEISRACLKIKPEQGAMKFLKKNGLTILDASYSANPVGVIADLNYLKIYPGKKVIVMPCLIELGKASKQAHKRIGRKIGEVCDLAIITTKERFKEIKGENKSILLIENPEHIVAKIEEFCKDGGVVLLEGRIPKEVIDLLEKKKGVV